MKKIYVAAMLGFYSLSLGCSNDLLPNSNGQNDSDSQAGGDGDSDADGDSDTDSDADTDADADGDGDTDTDADTDGDGDADADTDADSDGDSDTDADTDTDADADADADGDADLCGTTEETYSSLGVTCYIDSVAGDDNNTGLAEDQAVKTQAKIPSTCVVARYKRGSRFDGKMTLPRSVKVFTNYGDTSQPLPKFIVPTEPMSGPVISGMANSGVTFDGLYIAGARGDGTMTNLMGGICVFLGANSKLLNNEITSCDIGIMVIGEGSLVQGNYVHDLIMGVDAPHGVDPNLVGGAEGIFVNSGNNEVAYNTFVNCEGPAEWVGGNGDCDGGATEVTVGACATMSNVRIHHNFSYNSCGFLEISSGFGDCKGVFKDSAIYQNVNIDSAWMGLLQVNNTDLENLRYYNNTNVQHAGSLNEGLLYIIYTDVSSGVEGGDLMPNTVFLTNNLYVFDGVQTWGDLLHENFVQATNLIINTADEDPGFVNLGGMYPEDYDLVEGSPAINAGTVVDGNTLDFVNRTITDPSGTPDVGAFEFGSTQDACLPPRSPVEVVITPLNP
jgi:hypothetical protein